VVDIMPTDPMVLGFSNRWYPEAFQTARWHVLTGVTSIQVIEPIYLVATKLEAFNSRGEEDYDTSADLEDVLMLLAHRGEVRAAVERPTDEVSRFILEEIVRMRERLLRNDSRVLQTHLGVDESADRLVFAMRDWLRGLRAGDP
jgi:predicted nucleotidyltransferase